jgi:hypothetical protein
MEDMPSIKEMTGKIPLFFYDAIGRILPGAVFVVGTICYLNRNRLTSWDMAVRTLQTLFPKESTAGYSLAALLLFFGLSYFVGIILSSLSFDLVERPFRRLAKLDIHAMVKEVGVDSPHRLQERFQHQFGHHIPMDVNEASFLCSFYAWKTDANLGMMTARWDAEALCGRSLALVTLMFVLMPAVTRVWVPWTKVEWAWAGVWLVICISTCLSFNYLRKKRLSGRFGLLMALTSPHLPQ